MLGKKGKDRFNEKSHKIFLKYHLFHANCLYTENIHITRASRYGARWFCFHRNFGHDDDGVPFVCWEDGSHRADYTKKAQDILASSAYRPLPKDPTQAIKIE